MGEKQLLKCCYLFFSCKCCCASLWCICRQALSFCLWLGSVFCWTHCYFYATKLRAFLLLLFVVELLCGKIQIMWQCLPRCPPIMSCFSCHNCLWARPLNLRYGLNPLGAQLGDKNLYLPFLWIKKLILSTDKQLIASSQYQQDITRCIFYKILE